MKIIKNPWFGAGLFLLAIILLAAVFHYPVHIIDALTLEPQADFGIKISFWRILFEPVIGLLLYFNRALYPLDEILQLLPWVLIIFIACTALRGFSLKDLKDKKERRHFLLRQLVNLPLVFGMWLTVFVVLIFIPLPNNTIVNNSRDWVLVTTHSHTEWSHDGLISQERLWKWHKRNGFDAFFITDHNNHGHTLAFKKSQRNGDFPMAPLVMCGEEFSGTGHLSLLGLQYDFETGSLSDTAVVDTVHRQGGAVIVNHWFDGKHRPLEHYRNIGADGFEIENAGSERTYDRKIYRKIKDFAQQNNLILNGGLDFHGYGNACSLWNAFYIPGWHEMSPDTKESAILNIIRSREQDRLSVLLYRDRPFYERRNLFFRPLITFVNYFRTLNLWQVLSWALWLIVFVMIKRQFSHKKISGGHPGRHGFPAISGLAGSLLMLGLGMFYHFKIAEVAGSDNDIYIEYSNLFLIIGGVYLLYSAVVLYFRLRSAEKNK